MTEDDCVKLYRMASANGMRKVAEWFKCDKFYLYKEILELAERTEKGEA